jgi:DNA (cytosine-5)-methyltransferase 1
VQVFCKKNVKNLQKRFYPYICCMEKLTHGSLFSGIGGFDLAAEWMGWENKFHCEWNEFGQKVLHHYWPEAECFTDITKSDFKKYYGKIDILTGGFPCQPYSSAGKRKGKDDERHLWPEMLRAIREISPRFVVGENVRGLTNWNGGLVFEEVCAELESYGYQVAPVIIPACAVGAPHRRERIWFVAYADGAEQRNNTRANDREAEKVWRKNQGDVSRELSSYGDVTYSKGVRFQKSIKVGKLERTRSKLAGKRTNWNQFPTQSPVCSGDDGLSGELDGITFPKWRNESIKAYGNAIVPQVAYQIFQAIEKTLYL